MLFNRKFEVIENYEDGTKITRFLFGSKKEIKETIETIKKNSKGYQLVGSKKMIVWA